MRDRFLSVLFELETCHQPFETFNVPLSIQKDKIQVKKSSSSLLTTNKNIKEKMFKAFFDSFVGEKHQKTICRD
jgi:hypothetical protein